MKSRKIKYPHCKPENKTAYPTETDALRGITLIWGADPSADLNDLHTYPCPHATHFHIGHKSYYEAALRKNDLPNLSATVFPN